VSASVQGGPGSVRLEHRGAASWLIFDNVDRHNAMSLAMWQELDAALDVIERRAQTRVVVVRGEGERAFMSGADLRGVEDTRANPEGYRSRLEELTRIRARLARLPQPVVAMIHGYCLGGGLDIALRADLRIAAETAQFGIPAARLGIAYPADAIERLCRLVGTGNANAILLGADRFGADEALRIGLVNRVVPAGELEPHVAAYAEKLGGNAPLSMAAAKIAIASLDRHASADLSRQADEAAWRCQVSDDCAEGRAAFLAKRPPVFMGR